MAVCWGGSSVQHTATAVCSSTQYTDKQGAHPTSRSSTLPFDKVDLTMSIGASTFCAQQCNNIVCCYVGMHGPEACVLDEEEGGRGGRKGREGGEVRKRKRERRWRWRNR